MHWTEKHEIRIQLLKELLHDCDKQIKYEENMDDFLEKTNQKLDYLDSEYDKGFRASLKVQYNDLLNLIRCEEISLVGDDGSG